MALGSGSDQIRSFLAARQNADGAFQSRGGQSDLYYTAFGAEIFSQMPPDPATDALAAYLAGREDGQGLGFMDLVSLARARMRILPQQTPVAWRLKLSNAILRFQCPDGGFDVNPGSCTPSATATFMAWTALESLDRLPPSPAPFLKILQTLENPDGSFANYAAAGAGNVPATSAAIIARHCLAGLDSPSAVEWLLEQCFTPGGFLAFPRSPLPDLLSTGIALFSLRTHGLAMKDIATPCQAFIEGLLDPSGGYRGHELDPIADIEYTYYGLLGLGSLYPETGSKA